MTGPVPFRLSAIGQIALPSRDIARSVEFYRDKLGVSFVYQTPNSAFFECEGVRLMIAPGEGTSGAIVYFKVDDIHAAADALKSRGVVFERDPHLVARMPDHHLWMAFFRDPEGNLLALMAANASS